MTVRKRHSNAFETSPEPPRGVVRLLGFLISKPDRDEVLGDLDERFAYRVAEIGEEGARLWYRKQMLGIAVRWPLFLFARKRRELERSRQAGSREREWEGTRMDSFRRDLVYGIRTLWGKKGFSAMIVLTLALAIGATTTIFSMVSTLILQPVPFSDPHQIGFLWMSNAELSRPRVPLSLHDYLEMKDQLTAFSDLAAFHSANFSMRLTDGDTPERLTGYRTTPNFFPLMGVEILQGRGFLPREVRSDAFPVAVLSHGTWQRRFGSRAVLNEEIYLNGGVTSGGRDSGSGDGDRSLSGGRDLATPDNRSKRTRVAAPALDGGWPVGAEPDSEDGKCRGRHGGRTAGKRVPGD